MPDTSSVGFTITDRYEHTDSGRWSDFVKNHPRGTIFQTPEYYLLHKGCPGYEPVVISVADKQGEIAGILVAIISSVYRLYPLSYLTSRAVVFGGPLVRDNDPGTAQLLLNHFCRMMNRKVVYSQFRNLFDTQSIRQAFDKAGALYEEHLNILIDLHKSEEILWKEMKSQKRNKISKSLKNNLQIKEFTSRHELERSYEILTEVYRHAKLPLARFMLFDKALKLMHPKGMLKLFGAYAGDRLIAVRYILTYKETMYDWYAGSYRAYHDLNPNDLLPWEIMRQGRLQHFTLFDFGGAGKPGKPYGVRDFKAGFGGRTVNYGRYEILHNKTIYHFMRLVFNTWRRLRS
jgi:lipid II:glycine glycyltransferase (peptidoglycan interpeptide bridge formation enzyme)